ncbi:MAG: hypothetical protein GU359_05120 [Desulfurococcales archaeon]|jgi:hypothetical protein|nr:hypothetical protein [Desulfurococcales archaeon]
MRSKILTLILLILLISTTLQIYEKTYANEIYDNRHTIGFPQNITYTINISSSELSEIINQLKNIDNITSSCKNINCVQNISSSYIRSVANRLRDEGVLSNDAYDAINILSNPGSSDYKDLYSLINDPEIRSLLSQLNTSDIQKFAELANSSMNRLMEMYVSGRISYKEYAAALELIKRLALEKNVYDIYNLAGEREMDLLRAIIDRSYSDALLKMISASKDISLIEKGSSNKIFVSQNNMSGSNLFSGFEGLRLVQIMFPSIPLTMILEIAVVGVLITLIIMLLRLGVNPLEKISRYITNRGVIDISRLSNLPTPIKIYWMAVSILSKRVPRYENETHREYLRKIIENKDPSSQNFSKITEVYELTKYAGVINKDLEKTAEESFKEMSRR